jgi:hypothetical protein
MNMERLGMEVVLGNVSASAVFHMPKHQQDVTTS